MGSVGVQGGEYSLSYYSSKGFLGPCKVLLQVRCLRELLSNSSNPKGLSLETT